MFRELAFAVEVFILYAVLGWYDVWLVYALMALALSVLVYMGVLCLAPPRSLSRRTTRHDRRHHQTAYYSGPERRRHS